MILHAIYYIFRYGTALREQGLNTGIYTDLKEHLMITNSLMPTTAELDAEVHKVGDKMTTDNELSGGNVQLSQSQNVSETNPNSTGAIMPFKGVNSSVVLRFVYCIFKPHFCHL